MMKQLGNVEKCMQNKLNKMLSLFDAFTIAGQHYANNFV